MIVCVDELFYFATLKNAHSPALGVTAVTFAERTANVDVVRRSIHIFILCNFFNLYTFKALNLPILIVSQTTYPHSLLKNLFFFLIKSYVIQIVRMFN